MSEDEKVERIGRMLRGETCRTCCWRSRHLYNGWTKYLYFRGPHDDEPIKDLDNSCQYWELDRALR